MSTSLGWEGKGRYGSYRSRIYAGCAGKTVRSFENACHTWAQVCSRRGAIQIHIYLYLTFTFLKSGQIFFPFCHNSRVWQTDGQTDILIARPRLHSMQRGKMTMVPRGADFKLHCRPIATFSGYTGNVYTTPCLRKNNFHFYFLYSCGNSCRINVTVFTVMCS